jgi:hypothetical protein
VFGTDNVTAPVAAEAVIWFAVPAIDVTPVLVIVLVPVECVTDIPVPAAVASAMVFQLVDDVADSPTVSLTGTVVGAFVAALSIEPPTAGYNKSGFTPSFVTQCSCPVTGVGRMRPVPDATVVARAYCVVMAVAVPWVAPAAEYAAYDPATY